MVSSCNHVSSSRYKLARASRVKIAERRRGLLARLCKVQGIKTVIRMVIKVITGTVIRN